MQIGEVLNGYRITTPPTNAGGGMSQWSFAEKDGREYFFKMFLAPKFPLDDGPGSASAKARKRETCLAFEERHLDIAQRLQKAAPGSGNLVVARDFFRVDATYVKVMDRVVAVTEPSVHLMEPQQRLVFLRSLSYSLLLLHEQSVVHGDLKPDNVMVQQAGPGLFAAMLIDFDEGYVVGKPPTAEHIVGDPSYYSPELLRYIKHDERLPDDALSTASDMFSFGLLLHWFLTGSAPSFDRNEVKYPAEALLMRQRLDVSAAPGALRALLARLVDIVPSNRPTIREVIAVLAAATAAHISGVDVTPIPVEGGAATGSGATAIEPAPVSKLTTSGSLRTTGGHAARVDTSPKAGTASDSSTSGIHPGPPSGPLSLAAARAAGKSTTGPVTDPGSSGGLRSTMGKRKQRPPSSPPTEPPTDATGEP